MSKEKAEAEKILSEYGHRMFASHVRYFSSEYEVSQNDKYVSVRTRSPKRTAKRAILLCATMILIMSLAVVVASALGLQIFNYKFDIKDGFIVITNLNEESGSFFYKPEYTADGYSYKDALSIGDIVIYTYTDKETDLEYTIDESRTKESIVYLDNEGYDYSKEIYGEYELIVYREQASPHIIVYMEKNGTFISITGQLSIDQIHRIIDSLVIDDSI